MVYYNYREIRIPATGAGIAHFSRASTGHHRESRAGILRMAATNNHLVFYGNETLRKTAEEIKNINQKTIDLIESMFNVMYGERGIGLAAPQVGISQRLLILDIESYRGPVLTLINPVITARSDKTGPYEEGCLSVPGINAEITRPLEISVNAVTPDGKEMRFEAAGLLARVLQHEIDHLDGKLFIDHLEDHDRRELTAELKKIKKLNKRQ